VAEFIFMLTRHDATVPDALAVYDTVRDTALRHVGFKDIGVKPEVLGELCRRMRADGRTVYLEVVSVTEADELASIRAAREIGVDVVMGGTHLDAALPLLVGSPVRYFPFPGRVVGHPSVLQGSVEEICQSAAGMTARAGVHGLDLLAYRHADGAEAIIAAVVGATEVPVVVAGSIGSAAQIRAVTSLGAWGFTIGGAAFEHALPAPPTIRAQVEWALSAAREALDATSSA
jgi:hypothetical protein